VQGIFHFFIHSPTIRTTPCLPHLFLRTVVIITLIVYLFVLFICSPCRILFHLHLFSFLFFHFSFLFIYFPFFTPFHSRMPHFTCICFHLHDRMSSTLNYFFVLYTFACCTLHHISFLFNCFFLSTAACLPFFNSFHLCLFIFFVLYMFALTPHTHISFNFICFHLPFLFHLIPFHLTFSDHACSTTPHHSFLFIYLFSPFHFTHAACIRYVSHIVF